MKIWHKKLIELKEFYWSSAALFLQVSFTVAVIDLNPQLRSIESSTGERPAIVTTTLTMIAGSFSLASTRRGTENTGSA